MRLGVRGVLFRCYLARGPVVPYGFKSDLRMVRRASHPLLPGMRQVDMRPRGLSGQERGLGGKPGSKLPSSVLDQTINSLSSKLIQQMLESAAEEGFALLALALGCLACAAVIGVGYGIYEILSALGIVGGGKPKLLDTVQAAQRLAGTNSVALRLLALQFAYLAQNDVPLSSDAPGVQSLISRLVSQAVQGLEQEYGWTREHAAAVVTTYITGQPQAYCGAHCWNVPKQATTAPPPGSGQGSPPPGQGQPSPPISALPLSPQTMASPPSWTGLRNPTPPTAIRCQPGDPGYPDCLSLFPRVPVHVKGAIAGGAAALLAGQPELIPAGAAVGARLAEEAQLGFEGVKDFVAHFYRQPAGGFGQGPQGQEQPQPQYQPTPAYQPAPQPSYVPSGPPPLIPQPATQPAPILDTEKPCLTCQTGTQPRLSELRGQQGDLEQSQLIEQRQEIERLRGLERQPAQLRNIPQELQEKQALLQQVQQEIEQLQRGQQPGGEPSEGPNPPAQPAQPATGQPPAPIFQEQPGQQYQRLEQEAQSIREQEEELYPSVHPQKPEGESPFSPNAVRFCVQCTDQLETHRFLNGEPSECAVIPYPGGGIAPSSAPQA